MFWSQICLNLFYLYRRNSKENSSNDSHSVRGSGCLLRQTVLTTTKVMVLVGRQCIRPRWAIIIHYIRAQVTIGDEVIRLAPWLRTDRFTSRTLCAAGQKRRTFICSRRKIPVLSCAPVRTNYKNYVCEFSVKFINDRLASEWYVTCVSPATWLTLENLL